MNSKIKSLMSIPSMQLRTKLPFKLVIIKFKTYGNLLLNDT